VTKDVKYLFVNADCTSLKAEILDMDGNVVEGYTSDDCLAFSGDNCSAMIGWKSAEDLSFLKGKGFRIKFLLENGELYSFWLSDDKYGTSNGKYGAGYTGNIEELSLVAETTASVETTSVPADDSTVEKKSDKNGCGSTIIPTLLMVIAAIYLIVMKKKPRRQYEKQYNARSLSYYDNSIQQRR
jgi:hypothetical protein